MNTVTFSKWNYFVSPLVSDVNMLLLSFCTVDLDPDLYVI